MPIRIRDKRGNEINAHGPEGKILARGIIIERILKPILVLVIEIVLYLLM